MNFQIRQHENVTVRDMLLAVSLQALICVTVSSVTEKGQECIHHFGLFQKISKAGEEIER